MQEQKSIHIRDTYPELEPAYSILAKISENLESAEGKKKEIRPVLDSSLDQYDQAKEIFLAEDQPWAAVWVDLKKASLHCDLAGMANAMGRAVQIHTAMELIGKVLAIMPELPSNTDVIFKIYLAMIIPLFQVRSFIEEPEELEALDDLIRGVSENIGEALALDLSLRTEANDLKFTAGILEALADLEDDTQSKAEMLETSRGLSRQADENLLVSSPLDLSGYELAQEGK